MRSLAVTIALVAAAATACLDATAAGSGPNTIRLQSGPGDPVGAGQSYTYTQANAVIDVEASGDGQTIPVTLTVNVQGDESWTGFFTMPSGVPRIEPGTYQEDPRWHGSRGCNATGSFTIERVSYDGTRVAAIDLSFEQLCDGAAAALHGTIHWRSDDPTRAPGPVNPPPANLWRPASGATPAGVNFVYLQSDSGDYVGQGQTYLHIPTAATIGVTTSSGRLSITVSGSGAWSGDFLAMNSIHKLAPGLYPGLTGYWLTPNPTKGALDWHGPNRDCFLLTGWFAIDRLTYAADTLTAIDLRFEQQCAASPTAALHGAVHWAR